MALGAPNSYKIIYGGVEAPDGLAVRPSTVTASGLTSSDYTGRQGDRFGHLVGKGRTRTEDETKLMRLLALLIEDYDRRHALPPEDDTPGDRLRFRLEHSGKSPADLLPVFGQRSHVSEALNGIRQIRPSKPAN